MQERTHNEKGETLVEVLISLIVIGLVFGAFFAAITTTTRATTTQRYVVNADAVLRDYAENAKQEVRVSCSSSNIGDPFAVKYTPPVASQISVAATGLTCPALTDVGTVNITATLPNGVKKLLSIYVRTP